MSQDHSPDDRAVSRRELLRKGAVATTVAGLGLSGVVGSAAAKKEDVIPIDGPTTITEPGYYVLTQDIFLTDEPGAIFVEEEVGDVTIDGQGYTLDGTGKKSVGISAGGAFTGNNENITIKNLCVTGFTQSGISLGSSIKCAVKNVTFTDCEVGLRWISVNETVVKDCIFKNNSTGVSTTEGGTDDVFLRNHFVSNGRAADFDNILFGFLFKENRVEHNDGGVAVSDFVRGISIVGNEFYRNGFGVIVESTVEGLIKGNQFVENEGDGIDLRRARDLSIKKNHVLRNSGGGINLIDGVKNSTVSKNLVRGNAGDGILFEFVTDNEAVKNKVLNNGGDGIELRRSDDNVIRKNVIKGNAGLPIRIDDESTGNVVEKNKTDDGSGGDGDGNEGDDKDDGNGDICRVE